jgi:hypothetical protein
MRGWGQRSESVAEHPLADTIRAYRDTVHPAP